MNGKIIGKDLVFVTSLWILSTINFNSIEAGCKSDWKSRSGYCYYFSTKRMNWEAAEAECRKDSFANLASIHSRSEDEWIYDNIYESAFTGFNDIQHEGVWVWNDGTNVVYTNWEPGEPNNGNKRGPGWFDDPQDCGKIFFHNGRWDDFYCNDFRTYVCKRKSEAYCDPNPCRNNGICDDCWDGSCSGSTYYCDCDHIPYYGDHCEIGCSDNEFYRDGGCIDCNCQSICNKYTGTCGTTCIYGFIDNDCQTAKTPKVDAFYQEYKGNSGQPATFVCRVTANEADTTVTVTTSSRSHHGDVTSGKHPDYEFSNTYDDVVIANGEMVECKVMPGEDRKQIIADAYIQPVLTRDPWITDIAKHEMKVNWYAWDSSVDIGDGPIENYEVWYKVANANEFERYVVTAAHQTYSLITGLTPYMSYTFAVKTYRPGDGGGGDLGPTVTEQTLCDVPLGIPKVKTAIAVSKSEILVTWEIHEAYLEPEILRCASVTSYTIHYRVNGTSIEYETRATGPDQTSYLLNELDPCTEYEISVTMDNSIGHGKLSDPSFNTTLSSIPQEVEKLKAAAISSSEILVTWSQPLTIYCPLGGYILGFQQLSPYECGDTQIFEDMYFDATQFIHVTTDLYASTSYQATVTAYDMYGEHGPPSSVTEVTDESVPSEPRNVSAEGISDTEIVVTWIPPLCSNGTVTSYTIRYWQSTDGNVTSTIKSPNGCVDYTDYCSCTIGELMQERVYSVQVLAENGCCVSAWSDEAQAFTKSTPMPVISEVILLSCISLILFIVLILIFLGFLYFKRTGKTWNCLLSNDSDKESVILQPINSKQGKTITEDDAHRNHIYADPDDVIIKQCKTQDQENNYATFHHDKSEYESLADATRHTKTTIAATGIKEAFANLLKTDQETNESYLHLEWQELNKTKFTPKRSDCSSGRRPNNANKNRYMNILPLDKNREKLVTLVKDTQLTDYTNASYDDVRIGQDTQSTDYINASYVDAFSVKNCFLVTQLPFSHTVINFWRLVYDHKSNTIVMLNDTDKDNPGQYWPVDNVSEFGPFKIELLQRREIGCVVNRVLQLSMGDRNPSIIQQFQLLGWPHDISTSQFTSAFLELMIMIKRWQEQSGKGPITVHSLNGVGRTGVFCAAVSACERIQAEEVVDVYQTVKTLRKQRPNMVETLEQYRLCYEVAMHYCDVNVNLYNC